MRIYFIFFGMEYIESEIDMKMNLQAMMMIGEMFIYGVVLFNYIEAICLEMHLALIISALALGWINIIIGTIICVAMLYPFTLRK